MAKTIVHFELPAADTARAAQLYSQLFGWEFHESGMPGIDYRLFDGDPGGAVSGGDQAEAGSGATIYFGAEDIEASVARIRDLGGKADDKQPIPGIGWFARCHDTEGNAFSLFQSDESVQPPQT